MRQPLKCTPRVTARRQRPTTSSVRVVVPVLVAIVVEVVAVAVACLLGLSTIGVVVLAVVVALAGAVIERQTVGSLVAGAGIRVARPYAPGEQVRLFVPSLNSVEDAEVVRVGAANTTLMTSRGLVAVSNSRMLRGNPECRGKAGQPAA